MFILSLWLLCSSMQQQQQCVKSHLFEPVQETVQIHQAANAIQPKNFFCIPLWLICNSDGT